MAYGEAGATLDDGLWQPIAAKRISFLLNHFHPKYSPEFYCLLGSIYCLFTQDFEFGYELARLGIQLMEALDLKEINCRVSLAFNAATRFYQEPLSASLEPLLEAHQMGIETGDFFNAGYSAVVKMSDCLYVREGAELAERGIIDVEGCSQEDRLYARVSPGRNADEDGHGSDGGTCEPVERHHGSIRQGDKYGVLIL